MTWEKRIQLAKDNKFFNEEDKKLAQLWITDPISELQDRIKLRDNDLAKGPLDIYLILDGIYFTVGVDKNDISLAENCYKNIIRRVERLNNENHI